MAHSYTPVGQLGEESLCTPEDCKLQLSYFSICHNYHDRRDNCHHDHDCDDDDDILAILKTDGTK